MTGFRLMLPAILFGIWLFGVAGMHFRLAGPLRSRYLAAGRRMALLRQEYQPPRGRILDRNGTPLAWSERYFDLVWGEAVAPDALLLKTIAEEAGLNPVPEKMPGEKGWVLQRDLPPEALAGISPVLLKHPALSVRNRTERVVVDVPEVRLLIGETVWQNGALRGISGWEKEFDHTLRGTPGKFEVLLDRRHQWIESSWKMLEEAVPGEDVRVPWMLEESK